MACVVGEEHRRDPMPSSYLILSINRATASAGKESMRIVVVHVEDMVVERLNYVEVLTCFLERCEGIV